VPQQTQATLAFNRGILSDLGLARIDLTRYRMAALTMVNWICRVLGSMSLRPGLGYLTGTKNNLLAKALPFVFSHDDLARIEVTQGTIRVLISDALVTRPAVTAVITNGTFAGSLAGWTDSDETGAASTWNAGGFAQLVGTGTNNAILDQQVTINESGIEHALRIVITRGPITFRCGTTQGDDSLIHETFLGVGTHSLTFTPVTGSVWIRFMNPNIPAAYLVSVAIEGAGILELPNPWLSTDLGNIRSAQSADVTYVAVPGYQQRKIERRSLRSWSIVLYEPTDGPFRVLNVTPITLTGSALSGDITVTASKPLFKPTQAGALFRIASVGQNTAASISSDSTFTDPIRVDGIGDQRAFAWQVAGVFVGTVTLQVSVGAPGAWSDVASTTVPAFTPAYNDTFDNQVMYYRLGIKAGQYTSGTAVCTLSFSAGSITGIVKIRSITDSTHAQASVLASLGGTTESADWSEGAWSDFRGWPQTVKIHEGRLWWFGITIYGSVSDDFENFDDNTLGPSAPISRSIGEGAIENIYWAVSLQRLLVGTASAEMSCRSSSLDEPLTTTNFVIRPSSSQGSDNVDALRLDKFGIFVQIGGERVFKMEIDYFVQDYKAEDLTLLVPGLNVAGVVQIAVQRKPDTRLHCRRGDGSVAILVLDAAENVLAWQEWESPNGFVEDISILPAVSSSEDQVYYIVRRVIFGVTVRYHEKWALESQCTGLTDARLLDSHIIYSGAAVTTIGGLASLAGQVVSVWGWNSAVPYIDGNGNTVGRDLGTFTVSAGGQISGLPFQVTDACIGIPYTAPWQSMKQAFAAAMGTPLNQLKRIDKLGLILKNTHALGIQTGADFDHLDDLPLVDLPVLQSAQSLEPGEANYADVDAILNTYDYQMSAFDDVWSTDSRVCLQAASPRPCTVLAFAVEMATEG